MRSRSSNTEGSAPKQTSRRSKFQDTFQDMKHRAQKRDPSSESEEALPCPVSEKSCTGKGHQTEDLSRDDLLFLLSILEGELQVSRVGAVPTQSKGKFAYEFGVLAAREIDSCGSYSSISKSKA